MDLRELETVEYELRNLFQEIIEGMSGKQIQRAQTACDRLRDARLDAETNQK